MIWNIRNFVLAILVALVYGNICYLLNIPLWIVLVTSAIIGFNLPAIVRFK